MRSTSIPARWCFPAAASTRATTRSSPTLALFRRGGDGAASSASASPRIRETFEESGILLARPKGSKALVEAKRASEIEAAHRADLCDSKISFPAGAGRQRHGAGARRADALTRTGSRPRACRNGSIPGSSSPAAPPEQLGAHDGKESTDSIWVSPREALEGGETGRFKLPFPTTRNLIKLGKQASVKAALDDSRGKPVVTVTPIMTRNNGGRQLRIPLEAGYDGDVFEVGTVG
jgi:hypothetical protein